MDIAVIVTALAVVLMALQSLPLDQSMPGGTDTYSHLFRAWYATEYGLPQWNFLWWGGTTFLRYYSPLTYQISAVLGGLVGWLFAYKLLVDLFFVSLPVAFYFLSKDYLPDVKQRAVAVLVFSLSPIYLYALFDGRYPTLMSLLFCMVYWLFLKRYLDGGKPLQLFASSLMLGLALSAHILISGYAAMMIFLWAVLHSPKIRTVRALVMVSIFALFFSAWFIGPYFLETKSLSVGETSPSNLLVSNSVIDTTGFVLKMPFFWITQYSTSEFSSWIIFSAVMLTIVLSFLNASKLKSDRTVREFLPLLVLILVISVVSWRRVLLLAPIPLAVLSAHWIGSIKAENARKALFFLVVLIALAAFVSLRGGPIEATAPSLPQDGRVFFITDGSVHSVFLSPLNGNENIEGWFNIGEVSTKRYVYFSPGTPSYHVTLLNFTISPKEYYDALDAGWVNYIVVNANYTDVVRYFDGSGRFRIFGESAEFKIFELVPKSTYLELDGKPVEGERIKGRDSVAVNFACAPGTLTIKESWNELWNITVNGKAVSAGPNKYDFTEAHINESGDCTLEMKFSEPGYYAIFKLLWIVPFLWLAGASFMPARTSAKASRKLFG